MNRTSFEWWRGGPNGGHYRLPRRRGTRSCASDPRQRSRELQVQKRRAAELGPCTSVPRIGAPRVREQADFEPLVLATPRCIGPPAAGTRDLMGHVWRKGARHVTSIAVLAELIARECCRHRPVGENPRGLARSVLMIAPDHRDAERGVAKPRGKNSNSHGNHTKFYAISIHQHGKRHSKAHT